MGKTRNLFRKIGHIKGTFHARMGSIKDRNSMDLTEAEEEVARIHKKICIKAVFMALIYTMVWSVI